MTACGGNLPTMEGESAIECCTTCLSNRIIGQEIVEGCLPVPAFGDHTNTSVKVVTVALNPALNEYGPDVGKWKPKKQRLAIDSDYGHRRTTLTKDDIKDARNRRKTYFTDKERKWHSYFEELDALLRAVDPGWSYATGTAVHCDLVACATKCPWSLLNARKASKLAENCRGHFLKTLSEILPDAPLLLNGAFVYGELCRQGVYLKLKRGPESVCSDPLLIGWHGVMVLRDKSQRPFHGWSSPVASQTPKQRDDLTIWLREKKG